MSEGSSNSGAQRARSPWHGSDARQNSAQLGRGPDLYREILARDLGSHDLDIPMGMQCFAGFNRSMGRTDTPARVQGVVKDYAHLAILRRFLVKPSASVTLVIVSRVRFHSKRGLVASTPGVTWRHGCKPGGVMLHATIASPCAPVLSTPRPTQQLKLSRESSRGNTSIAVWRT